MSHTDLEAKKAKAKKYYQDNKAKWQTPEQRARRKQYRQDNRDKLREANKSYRRRNPEKIRNKNRQYVKKNRKRINNNALARYYLNADRYKNWYKDSYINGRLKKAYGITLDQYNELITKQNGVCAICCNPETIIIHGSTPRALSVDHDHTTLKVRGLLCDACNKGIGFFKDDPAQLIAAAKYLTEHKEK